MDAIVDTREDELAAAEDAHDEAVDMLDDAQEALSDLQEALMDAQEVLQSALAAEAAASLEAKHNRLDKIRSVQWFLKKSGHPKWKLTKREDQEAFADADLSEWVVAVLDSGVAYENHADDAGTYVAAPSLSSSAIVAPWDFINNDAHANDDHQHGTHIASIIASTGDLQGLAPSVSLMPIKVLDANNQGTELDLVAGIWHAIDNGAHVINMSLSFDSSYIPSLALRDAIAAAADAGIVMVAAAGNNGDGVVTWPAASPHVVAISSATLKDNGGHLRSAEYSNMSNGVALAAAGGLVDGDENDDGYSDGILAETIALNDPTRTGWWFYAGTSQAAALVSAAAVHLLDAGATGPEAANALQFAADDGVIEGEAHLDGFGSGALDLESALEALEDDRDKLQPRGTYHVAMLPYLKWKRVEEYDDKGKWKCKEQTKWKVKDGDKIEPTVLFTVFDDAGAPVKDVEVMGLMWGTKEGSFKCKTNAEGVCKVKGQSINPSDYQHAQDEMEVAQAWQVEALVHDNIGQVPSNMIFATDGFDTGLAKTGSL